MKRDAGRALPILFVALLAAILVGVLALRPGMTAQVRYYAQTGRLVRDPFLSFYFDHGEAATFGFPLTDAYQTSDHTLVQTFQRAQLQLSIRGVELAPIGVSLQLGEPGSASTHSEFLPYYEAHGGAGFFGLPLGPARVERGVLVQDFERARLVRDELGNVHLANLGSVYLSAYPPPVESGQASLLLQGTPSPPPEVRAALSVERPTAGQGDQQTIYLYLEDEQGRPVAGAQALAMLRYNGATAEVTLPNTDERGLTSTSFIVPPASPGTEVIVEVHVLFGETFLTTETTYFQWW